MENQINSKQIIINYGLILAAISVSINVILYAMGQHLKPHWSISIITGIAFITLIILAIKKFKIENKNLIEWMQAVKIGVGVAIIAALIGTIYNYIFMNFIEPDFLNQVVELQNEQLSEQGYTDEQIEAANKMGETFRNPVLISAMGIIGSAIGGFVVSAIAGAIMKKTVKNNY